MPENINFAVTNAEAEIEPAPLPEHLQSLQPKAEELGRNLKWLPNSPEPRAFDNRVAAVTRAFAPILDALRAQPSGPISDDYRWLYDNDRLIYTGLYMELPDSVTRKIAAESPHVRDAKGAVVPRALAVAEGFLEAVNYRFSEQELSFFVEVFQRGTVLQLRELRLLPAALTLVLLEQIAWRGQELVRDQQASIGIGVCMRSLRDMSQATWKEILEPLISIDQILRQDPAGAYAQMDYESRDVYRTRIARIAARSDFSETEVAEAAVALAREASKQPSVDPRVSLRESHVGYYIIDKGLEQLAQRTGYRAPWPQRIQDWMRRHPDEFFFPGIEILTLAIASGAVVLLTDPSYSLAFIAFAMLFLLLPSSQTAVQLTNYLVTLILPAETLSKLDFSESVPANCVTLVAVPSLLLNEKQVRTLVEDLEVRFLGNHDPNIHFALVTDLPDSREPDREDSELVTLCSELIRGLNERYASQKMGSFFLLHRHRVYNPREKSWMGWERKRGKLLDLNKLLRGQYDSFPVKVGDTSLLSKVRFVLTLDSDTELPRGIAHRLIGTMAHPLNQAIIDPAKNIVVSGYGILQPRVGVSVQSTAISRLAAIYAGETGFDIYTRAISDAYQDLYGEGSYTGKGIYEVDAVLRVLDRRFPRNSLLSHDLIEGAYGRSGLVSDIEVIEDYPSHYSAYNRRKHRWLRGDWQIAQWLLPEVPDESGHRAPNPISMISWWKIFDNLRRSLVEPAIFALFLFGWLLAAPSAWAWTLIALCILFMPAWFQFVGSLVRAMVKKDSSIARQSLTDLYTGNINVFFTLTFLAHQTLISLDAVVRALFRRFITNERLLEWETAAEAELGTRGETPIDLYLNWMPVFALAVAALVWSVRPHALWAAIPILMLWACSKMVALWLNRSPAKPRNQASRRDVRFVRRSALFTWRYFAEFSTEEHNWLIPDNVQEEPWAVAARVSPTNLGLLLNSRQVACELGYLTVPEFVEQTERTLKTLASLRKHRGHLLNWYDTRTLEPLAPRFVSSVDSGNLLASLWTLQQGCLDRLHRPALQPSLAEGCLDYLRVLSGARAFPRKVLAQCERQNGTDRWLQSLLELPDEILQKAEQIVCERQNAETKKGASPQWMAQEAAARVQNLRRLVSAYAPWLSAEFEALRGDPTLNLKLMENTPLESLPQAIEKLIGRLEDTQYSSRTETNYERFRVSLLRAKQNVLDLIADLRSVAADAGKLANDMDFRLLFNKHRKMLSVGYDVDTHSMFDACYDLLATESRTAIFIAIAKEDIPQESWFLLGRAHTLDKGRSVLLSWTGTMFEYLMPALWMRSFPNTLLERSCVAAVCSQQAYGMRKGVPWGISESAYSKRDDAGNYQYYAFGLADLGLRKPEIDRLVISPYSSFLALNVDPVESLRNLERMYSMGWFGDYGFYESADFSGEGKKFWKNKPQLATCWMAHHQGMSLLAVANFLNENIVQKWFHAERRVLATELLLHEKPVAHVRKKDIPRRFAA
jgi:cyclic beta-1,2-glucan synthetase